MIINHSFNYRFYNDDDEDITTRLLWEAIKLNTKYQDLDLYIAGYLMDIPANTDSNP